MKKQTNLLTAILAMAQKKNTVLCIEGDAAAGKTTKATALQHILKDKGFSVSVIHMDDFFLPFDMKTAERLATAGENIHHERFLQEVAPLLQQKANTKDNCTSVRYGKFDCSIGKITTQTTLQKSDIYIVEGSYSMNKNLIDLYDITVFMKIDPKTQTDRICQRNTPEIAQRYQKEWIPMEKHFHTTCKLEQKADFVISAK